MAQMMLDENDPFLRNERDGPAPVALYTARRQAMEVYEAVRTVFAIMRADRAFIAANWQEPCRCRFVTSASIAHLGAVNTYAGRRYMLLVRGRLRSTASRPHPRSTTA